MRRMMLPALIAAAVLVPSSGFAQSDRSHWGVVASVTPSQSWNVISPIDEFVFEHEGTAQLTGTDVSIGIARGRWRGGDWGVSYIRRTVNDGSRFERTTEVCIGNSCSEEIDEYYLTRGMAFNAIEGHKYLNIVTFAGRGQVGVNLAGGIGSFSGELERHTFQTDFQFVNNQVVMTRTETVTMEPAREIAAFSPFPTGKVELAAGALVLPGLKVRASGGLNFPGYSIFRVTGVYLFGGD